MIYIIVALYSTLYYYAIERLERHRLFALVILGLSWLLIMGWQYNANSDYINYVRVYQENPSFYGTVRAEYAFSLVMEFSHFLGSPRYMFVIISVIQIALTFAIFEKYRELAFGNFQLFVFAYFLISGIFPNQMGFIRNFTAILFFNYAVFAIMEKKPFLWIALMLMAGMFHASGLLLLPLYLLRGILFRKPSKVMYVAFLLLPLVSLLFKDAISPIFKFFTPAIYSGYINYDSEVPLLTKTLLIPIYFLGLALLDIDKLSPKARFMMNMGFFVANIHFYSNAFPIVARFFQFGDLVRCMPVYLALLMLKRGNSKIAYLALLFYISVYFVSKVTFFAEGTYLYDSILFPIIHLSPE